MLNLLVHKVTARLSKVQINLFILSRIFAFVCSEGQRKHIYVLYEQNAEGLYVKPLVYTQIQGFRVKIHLTKQNWNLLKCLDFVLVLCLT
jgi:hypothetical protein